jgi:hypothetical protein
VDGALEVPGCFEDLLQGLWPVLEYQELITVPVGTLKPYDIVSGHVALKR